MSTAVLIGLTTVGILAIWDSQLLKWTQDSVRRWGTATGRLSLIYFIDCHMCKGFWLCLAGGFIAGNGLLSIPAYGVVAVCLAVMGECDE